MMKVLKKIFLSITVACFLLVVFSSNKIALGQTSTPTPTPNPSSQISNIKDCKDSNITVADCPAFLQKKVSELSGQANTLASQVAVLDNQTKLTESRIAANQYEITNLTLDIDTADKKIDNLQESLDNLSQALVNRIKSTYVVGAEDPFHVLLSSSDASNFFKRLNYLKIAQAHDRRLIVETTAAKNDYENQKGILEDKKKQIEMLKKQQEAYRAQLDEQKQSKQVLLTQTQGSEATYRRLLSQAQAEVSALKTFANSRGGSSILPPQDSPDGWYYNQRDERWGRNNIGSSPEQMWEVGCLVTATTMLRKQRGESITPADVAKESSYFFANTAMMNIPWNGGRFTSKWTGNLSEIDSKLSSGPIIVGLNAGPYGTHFIVLKSGSNGDYIMNDPWEGANLRFSDYYLTSQIFQYGYLN